MSRKNELLKGLYDYCVSHGDMTFDNDTVKRIPVKKRFGNPFDATKLDNTGKLPQFMKDNDICILHLGGGNHRFVKGIKILYHKFEPIQERIVWKYRKSLLNEYNDSESNILSVANNQRILHDFLFGEDLEFDNLPVDKRPKTYFPHRTKTTLEYNFGKEHIIAENLQIEIDLTIEYNGTIYLLEASNKGSIDFNIYRFYTSVLHYYQYFPNNKVMCAYVLWHGNSMKLYLYEFNETLQINSLKFIKSCEYVLNSA